MHTILKLPSEVHSHSSAKSNSLNLNHSSLSVWQKTHMSEFPSQVLTISASSWKTPCQKPRFHPWLSLSACSKKDRLSYCLFSVRGQFVSSDRYWILSAVHTSNVTPKLTCQVPLCPVSFIQSEARRSCNTLLSNITQRQTAQGPS